MNYYSNYQNQDRQFFFPFLVGAVTGGAAVGLTRPRPVYTTGPSYYPSYGYYNNYGYYYPRYPYYR